MKSYLLLPAWLLISGVLIVTQNVGAFPTVHSTNELQIEGERLSCGKLCIASRKLSNIHTADDINNTAAGRRAVVSPDGRGQYVAYKRIYKDIIVSTYGRQKRKVTQKVGATVISLVTVIDVNANTALVDAMTSNANVASSMSQWLADRMSEGGKPAHVAQGFYNTLAYNQGFTVIAQATIEGATELESSNMAQAISNSWGLGSVVSSFIPTNGRKRDVDRGSCYEIVSDNPMNQASGACDTTELVGIVSDVAVPDSLIAEIHAALPDDKNEEYSPPGGDIAKKSVGYCYNWDLRTTRKRGWNAWDTSYSTNCFGEWWQVYPEKNCFDYYSGVQIECYL